MKTLWSPRGLFFSYIFVVCSSYIEYSLATAAGGTQCKTRDSKGVEFIVGFLDTLGSANTHPVLYIVGTSRIRTVVNIDAPGGLNLRSFLDDGTRNKKIEIPDVGPSSRAVLVTADHDISVFGVDEGNSMDAYLALPTDALGNEYYVASYRVSKRVRRQDRGSQFLIMGIHENTHVDITLKGTLIYEGQTRPKGSTLSLTVGRLQTLYFISEDEDLTGTHIVSDAPVGVISGSKCTDVPHGTSYCDHLVEQIPPVNTWGKHFITSPLAARSSGDVFRVIASRDNTMVEIDGERIDRINVDSGEYWEFQVRSNESRTISASQPVLVMQYSKGGGADNTQADPFMMLVPAIEQFPRDPVYFITPESSLPLSHHANVIVDCQHTGALYHNTFQLPETSFSRLRQLRRRVGNHEYCIAQMDLELVGEHMLEHRLLNIAFSVLLYGFATSGGHTATVGEVAYGMPVGLTLNDISCYGIDTVIDSSQYDSATQRNSRNPASGDITRVKLGKLAPTYTPFISFPSKPRLPGDVTASLAPSYGVGHEKSGRYLMWAIMIGMFSLVTILFLVAYIIVLKKRIRKLEAERKGYNRIQVSSMMVGPDGYIGLDGSQAGERDYMTLNQPQGMWRLGRIRRVNGEIQRVTPRVNVNNIGSPTKVSNTQTRATNHKNSVTDASPPSSVTSTQERGISVRRPHEAETSAVHLVRQASTRSQPPCSGRHTSLVVSPPHRQSSFRDLSRPPRRKTSNATDNQVNYNSSNETCIPRGSHLRRSVSQTEATAHHCGPKSYYSVPKKRPFNLVLYDRPRKRASSIEIPTGLPAHDMLPRHDDGYMSMKDPRTSVISHASSVVSRDFSLSSPTSGICDDFSSSPTSVAPLLDNKTYTSIPDENHNNANDARGGRGGAGDTDSIDYTELV